MGNDNFTAAPSGTFRTGTGLLNIAANTDDQFVALAMLLERPDLVTDPRFLTRELRKRNREVLTQPGGGAVAPSVGRSTGKTSSTRRACRQVAY